ncbi:unnamed protein product [Protopolystoma xenopodis]|uniref:Uncharacterized protein n=1 Tax=Protopolystoma xenopodis TaxID=117903 RepID=A0A448WCY4_9PLAT|nr:unnamed protein product [Protopolystoma xenopodis]
MSTSCSKWRHRICSLSCSPPCRVADPAPVSCPDLPHAPVSPFLLFLVHRFTRFQPLRTFAPNAISQAFSVTFREPRL